MEFRGYHSFSLIVVAAILLGLTVLFLIRRLKRSESAIQSDEVTGARLRRVYVCVLLMAGGVIVFMGARVLLGSSQEQQGYVMLVGMFLVPIYWIALPVAAYNSLLRPAP